MINKALKELIKEKVTISVGEPWDFTSDAGQNILKGTVSLVSNENETEWLKCDVSPFASEKYRITSVVAVNRYAKQSFELLLKGEKITANFLYEPNGRELDSTQISTVLQKQAGMKFLVGSIQVTPI